MADEPVYTGMMLKAMVLFRAEVCGRDGVICDVSFMKETTHQGIIVLGWTSHYQKATLRLEPRATSEMA